MAVPDFQTVMRPILVALADGQALSSSAIRASVAQDFSLKQADLDEKLPSGRAKTFDNRVGWALTYMHRALLVDRPKRSTYRISERGKKLLSEQPDRVDLKVLSQFPEFVEFKNSKPTGTGDQPASTASVTHGSLVEGHTPEEQIDSAYAEMRAALAAEVLDRVREQSPDFFEQLVLDVLRAMGYGGTLDEAAQRLGQSGDEGVDGVIREDELGLDLIYVQAKRWANPVGRPEIQKFFGALHGQRATKGVFITTSVFTKEAVHYADGVTPRVILVDGQRLARLMVAHNVGVTVARAVEMKRLNLDYFTTDEDAEAGPAPDPTVVE